jgi:hypothetical protein
MNDFNVDLMEMRCGLDHGDQDRYKEGAVLDVINNLRLPHGEGYFLTRTATAVVSRNTLRGIATGYNRSFAVQCKCAQIAIARSPRRLNFLRCRLIFGGPQDGSRFMSFSETGLRFLENL